MNFLFDSLELFKSWNMSSFSSSFLVSIFEELLTCIFDCLDKIWLSGSKLPTWRCPWLVLVCLLLKNSWFASKKLSILGLVFVTLCKLISLFKFSIYFIEVPIYFRFPFLVWYIRRAASFFIKLSSYGLTLNLLFWRTWSVVTGLFDLRLLRHSLAYWSVSMAASRTWS